MMTWRVALDRITAHLRNYPVLERITNLLISKNEIAQWQTTNLCLAIKKLMEIKLKNELDIYQAVFAKSLSPFLFVAIALILRKILFIQKKFTICRRLRIPRNCYL